MTDVVIRGATDNRDDTVIIGKGMTNRRYGDVPFGIWTGNGVARLTIANLTLRDFYVHPIIFNAGTHQPRVYNVRLVNAGEQFIKANPDGNGGGVDGGLVEYCVLEYDTVARSDYTNGVDVHSGRDWIIRHNLFRRIRSDTGLAGPAVLMWTDGAIVARDGAEATVTGNLTTAAAAWFVDLATGDLHLTAEAAPATDAAGASPDVTSDWDGDARPAGARADLGADERSGAAAPTAVRTHGPRRQ